MLTQIKIKNNCLALRVKVLIYTQYVKIGVNFKKLKMKIFSSEEELKKRMRNFTRNGQKKNVKRKKRNN